MKICKSLAPVSKTRSQIIGSAKRGKCKSVRGNKSKQIAGLWICFTTALKNHQPSHPQKHNFDSSLLWKIVMNGRGENRPICCTLASAATIVRTISIRGRQYLDMSCIQHQRHSLSSAEKYFVQIHTIVFPHNQIFQPLILTHINIVHPYHRDCHQHCRQHCHLNYHHCHQRTGALVLVLGTANKTSWCLL